MVSAAAGVAHSMALASDGSLFTWGDGRYGQLGQSMPEEINAMMADPPVLLMCCPVPKRLSKLDPNELPATERCALPRAVAVYMGRVGREGREGRAASAVAACLSLRAPPPSHSRPRHPCPSRTHTHTHRRSITAIAAGGNHSIALTVGGGLVGFGRNKNGALGTGDVDNRWRPTKVPLALAGEAERELRAVQVVCGDAHTLVLLMVCGRLQARSAGLNSWGQLGHGDRKERHRFARVAGLPAGVIALQAGDDHSAAVTQDGDLYLWGRGDCGQLGLGEEHSRWRPTRVPGYRVVGPSKTLRRSKRSQPILRPIAGKEPKSKVKTMCHHQ